MNGRSGVITLFLVTPLLGCTKNLDHQQDTSTPVANAAESLQVSVNDWPWWRGPRRDGKSAAQHVPQVWSETKNVAWKTPVPGRGHSTPSIWGDRVFLTTADEEKETQSLLCFARSSGKPLWQKVLHQNNFDKKHNKNSYASPTVACDGKRVYTSFINDAALQATATDLDGKILWKARVGDFDSEHGYASSPILYGPVVILLADSLNGSFVTAINRRDGKAVWTTPRADGPVHANYSSPIVGDVAGRPQLLVAGSTRVDSYDPQTGKQLWFVTDVAQVVANTMTFEGDFAYASGGYPEKFILGIRADGEGDVTDTHVVWQETKSITYVPSPIAHEGRLYLVNDQGIGTCLDSKTGDLIWRERIGGNFTASPVLINDYLYCSDESGKTTILKTGDKFEVVTSNSLDNGIFATPVICGGQIFVRTHDHLYCIAES